jgi:ATP-dependent phosphofructokinase / diphosphate-dependent phosphofructokinase
MMALQGNEINTVSLAEVVSQLKNVPVEGELVRTARSIGIGLGD